MGARPLKMSRAAVAQSPAFVREEAPDATSVRRLAYLNLKLRTCLRHMSLGCVPRSYVLRINKKELRQSRYLYFKKSKSECVFQGAHSILDE